MTSKVYQKKKKTMTSKAKRKKEKNDKQNNDDRGQKIKKKKNYILFVAKYCFNKRWSYFVFLNLRISYPP